MLASVKTSANGSPSLRAKRLRTASRLVMESPSLFGMGVFSVRVGAAPIGRGARLSHSTVL
jgi:hypothetical protein